MAGYDDPVEFFVARLAEGIACIAAAFAPHPVIVRLSDFKTNEYANLIGGQQYEPQEENPMLGFRGASRYVSESFRPCFDLECHALETSPQRDGTHQRRGDGAIRTHRSGRSRRHGTAGAQWLAPR